MTDADFHSIGDPVYRRLQKAVREAIEAFIEEYPERMHIGRGIIADLDEWEKEDLRIHLRHHRDFYVQVLDYRIADRFTWSQEFGLVQN